MRVIAFFILIFFSLGTFGQTNSLLDSVLAKSHEIENIQRRVLFLKNAAADSSLNSISLELLQEARIFSSANSLPINLELYHILGEKYTENFMFRQAINIYDTLRHYYSRKKDFKNQIISFDEMARNYLRAGMADSALECYLSAEKLLKFTKDEKLKFRIYYNIAHFYFVTDQSPKLAHNYLSNCNIIAERLNSDSLRIEYLMETGRIYVYSEDYDSADFYFDKTQALIDKTGNFNKIDQFYGSLAYYYQAKGDLKLALKYYLDAYAINLKKKNYVGLYVNSYNLFMFYSKQNDIENAEKYLVLSLKYADITNIQQYRVATYEQLHLFYSQNGNYAKAYEYLLLMNKSVESMHYKELNTKIADLTIQYDVLKTQDAFKLLKQENQIQSLNLRNDKLIIFGLIVLMIGVGLYFVLIFRQNKIKAKQKTDQLMLRNLMQQMNPHFIFNTLNSIQYYMYNHSELDTSEYISKFATLIRRILDNSHNNNISIAEEIETVKLYIELEQIRFNDNFDFELKIAHELQNDEMKIPSMFIQPFVENAIIHGLKHKTGKGFLSISVSLKSDIVEFVIEDTGVGRTKSDVIN